MSRSSSVIGMLMILVSTLFLVAILSNSSSPSVDINTDIQGRRLSKHHHNHTYNQDEDIDYTIYSCDALRELRRKFDNKPDRRFDQCKFAHDCNEGDGIIFPSLFCDYDTTPPPSSSQHSNIQYHHIPLLVFLSLCLLLLFRLLNSTTDEFFSPGLELFSLKLGLPPRFAGVTLLALGNGAPDVAATMNAILGDERRGYEMALGELTGTCMFVTSVILGVIVSLSGHSKNDNETSQTNVEGESPKKGSNKKDEFCNPESLHESRRESARSFAMEAGVPCRGPLLRDIAVLILVCVVSMSYLKRGIIDYGFVYTLLGMYLSYVLLVLMADAYHIFYHAPLKRGDSGLSLDDLLLEEEDDDSGAKDDVEEDPINEQTSLIQSSTTKPTFTRRAHSDRHHHKQHAHHLYHNNSLPIHSHTIGETVIEAMSNYSCNESQPLRQHHPSGMQAITTNESQESKTSDIDMKLSDSTQAVAPPPPLPRALSPTTSPSGWAPVEDDGAEPLVIFHPHHAIHPHHGHGGLFLRSKSTDSAKRRQFSWSEGDKNAITPVDGKLRHSSSCDASSSHASLSDAAAEAEKGVSQQHHTGVIQITNSNVTEDADNDIRNLRPTNWNEAISENIQEFTDHWHDFFTDIYHNEENSLMDVVLLSMELPFTIIRKFSIPVPCDGYYCRPLVAISLPLSSIWIWYYILEQYDTDLFQSYVGYVISAITFFLGVGVMRYAPGGEGPMDLYMVIPLTLYGFAVSATWLDSIADKLVELLELFGVLLRIPSTVLGLTVLAFGNSIQDLVANVTLSKRGLSTMATTACFAGPIFNLCIGLSVGFWVLMKSTGKDHIRVELPRNIATGFCFTIVNCGLIVFAGVVIGKGMIGKSYGYVACALYTVYVLTSLYV